jgi:uncharacterized protein YndB with AHSA1/START domain
MNELQPITIQADVCAPLQKVWDYYTLPEHITQWNFADPSWHCPWATNDLHVGGRYVARMQAKDGSFGFDFEATYTEMHPPHHLSYAFGGRNATVVFKESDGKTQVTVTFDPETQHPIDMQRDGWQAILNNFKTYTENH